MPAHSRSKNGVLSNAYVAGIHVLMAAQRSKTWMAGINPAMTQEERGKGPSHYFCSSMILSENRLPLFGIML